MFRTITGRLWGLRVALGGGVLAAGLAAAPSLTTVQDILYKADGTRFNGTAVVSWRSFEASDRSAITMHNLTVKIVDGNLRVQLVPNAGATPAAHYAVKYSSDGKIQFEESWLVPASSRAVRLRDVRVAAPAAVEASGQLTEDDVAGLVADLNARPVRGPGYAPGRAAVISAGGTLESAVGDPADCVRVDGSSGPCGGGGGADPGFVDNESPAGAVDGSNVVFSLTATPSPARSLALYRNGMLMKAGEDYTLADRGITFVEAAAPQPGDTLLASYRRQMTAVPVTTPQVLCSGTGASTSETAAAVLGACEIPAGLLAAGDRLEVRFDYTHAGSQAGFTFTAAWNDTVMVSRTAGAGESLASGRAEAVLAEDATQISAQTWGAQLSLGTAVASAPAAAGALVRIELRGGIAAAEASLKLQHYTVIRYPAPTV
jgi:hypothetical protein